LYWRFYRSIVATCLTGYNIAIEFPIQYSILANTVFRIDFSLDEEVEKIKETFIAVTDFSPYCYSIRIAFNGRVLPDYKKASACGLKENDHVVIFARVS
jgi:hypothetical protein